MNALQFDSLAKLLASGHSRRDVVSKVVKGALLAVTSGSALRSRPAIAQEDFPDYDVAELNLGSIQSQAAKNKGFKSLEREMKNRGYRPEGSRSALGLSQDGSPVRSVLLMPYIDIPGSSQSLVVFSQESSGVNLVYAGIFVGDAPTNFLIADSDGNIQEYLANDYRPRAFQNPDPGSDRCDMCLGTCEVIENLAGLKSDIRLCKKVVGLICGGTGPEWFNCALETGTACGALLSAVVDPFIEGVCDISCEIAGSCNLPCTPISCETNEFFDTDFCECRCMFAEGVELCGTSCTDVRSDRQNCGKCGAVCSDGDYCNDSICVPKTIETGNFEVYLEPFESEDKLPLQGVCFDFYLAVPDTNVGSYRPGQFLMAVCEGEENDTCPAVDLICTPQMAAGLYFYEQRGSPAGYLPDPTIRLLEIFPNTTSGDEIVPQPVEA